MKETLRIAAVTLCVSAICGTAAAAGSTATASDRNSMQASTTGVSQYNAQDLPAADNSVPQDLNRVSKVIGTDVKDASGKKIGDIKDVVVDRSNGRVAYAVVSFGGVMGMGDKYFAVPWKALKPGTDKNYVLNTSKDTLKKAQGFDKDHWPDMANETWNRNTYRLYNQTPYWEQASSSEAQRNANRSSGSSNADSSKTGSQNSGATSSSSK